MSTPHAEAATGHERKGRRRRPFRLLLIAGLIAAAYLVLFGGEYSFLDLRRIEREHEAQLERLEALQDTVAALRARVDSLENDPATLERIARERFGLIMPGERLYRFVGEPPADVDRATSSGRP